ncbi:MAG: carboxypeptidase-like regulatory domain-containing protein, partial [Tannerellaceae bacterium]
MKYLLVLILSFCMINVSAQSIKGVVIDNETKQPIEYANIILKNKVDSSYMSGTISDINGAFSISSKDINNSYLTLSRVDYNEYIVSTLSNVDTIRVELTSAVLSLDNVVVTAARPISKMTANGLQTTVANTVLSEIGTGNDVLKRIPMVTGDKGVFEVFGRGQAKIYINNREVRNSSEVDNLNSNDIQSIEVISNPGAKYDATVSAVILIKTIKKRGDGFSLNVRSSFYTGKNQDYINQINTNYRKESLDIFANLYYTDITNLQIGDISQTVRVDTLWHQENTMDAIRHTSDLNGSLGLNYEIKEKHNIGFKYDLRTSPIGRSVDIKLKSDVYAN